MIQHVIRITCDGKCGRSMEFPTNPNIPTHIQTYKALAKAKATEGWYVAADHNWCIPCSPTQGDFKRRLIEHVRDVQARSGAAGLS